MNETQERLSYFIFLPLLSLLLISIWKRRSSACKYPWAYTASHNDSASMVANPVFCSLYTCVALPIEWPKDRGIDKDNFSLDDVVYWSVVYKCSECDNKINSFTALWYCIMWTCKSNLSLSTPTAIDFTLGARIFSLIYGETLHSMMHMWVVIKQRKT